MTEADKLALCRAMVEQPADKEGWSDDVLKSYLIPMTIPSRKYLADTA